MTNNKTVLSWIDEMKALVNPDQIVWIDGSEEQLEVLRKEACASGELIKLNEEKLPGCYYHRTAPNDVARVEDRTLICSKKEEDAGPTNHWKDPQEAYKMLYDIARGSYKGRTMYVIPYSMGPIGSPLAKIGIELTDSIYVVLNMSIMTRVNAKVLDVLGDSNDWVRGLHCKCNVDPENRWICQFPEDNTIISVNSAYGGNVLLGKKCFALRIAELFRTPRAIRSNYIARVDKEKCVACGQCVENCQTNALKLGQKLCSKKAGGQVPEYPRQELPDATKWDHTKWSPNYRNDNRIETHESGTAPCKTACPAHVAVQGYLKLAAQGRYDEALALIKRENPLPAICGRVCNRRCEDACTRGRVDAAVAIDEVKKFIAQRDLDAAARYVPPVVTPTRAGGFDQKIAIIGAGPAGLSCAFYLAEKGYKPVVFEKNERPGGMLTYGIPSFKLQKDVIEAEVEIIRLMGAEFRYGVEVGRDVTLDELRAQGFKAFYVAIGCQGGRLAGIPGEDAEDVTVAVDFLREVNSGKIDALPGRTIVVGGGNVAIDVARNACRLGSEHVEMFCLESEAQMPASEEERREAVEDGAHISCGWGPKEIHLDEAGRVCGITFKRCTRVFDDEGRFAPEYDENDLRRVDADRVVMSIGQSIVWGDLLAGSKVELGRGQGALADPQTYQTAEPDIFVGGDVYTGPSFAIDAIAAGHEAAVSIHRFVQPGSTLTIGRNQRRYTALDRDDVVLEGYDNASREVAHVDREREKAAPFSEYVETFTEEQVRAETARCLGCGASIVDPNKCIGCGLCTTKCAFDAIHLDRDRPECSTMVKYEQKLPSLGKYALKRAIKIKFGKK